MSQMPRVSIVINTLNRAKYLMATLESLKKLRYAGEFEVIVVNGPSTDETAALLEEWQGLVRIGDCNVANLSVSRNIGIAMASGEIIAFLDDDAIPEPEWLSQLAGAYENPNVGAVGGVVFDNTGYEFQYQFARADRFGRADLSPTEPQNRFSFPGSRRYPHILGCNSSFRRTALLEVQGFDEEFEYFLDETDVCLRLVDAGYHIVQLPNAYVHHKFAPSNLRLDDKILRHHFPVIKNKIYFGYKHARQIFGLERVERESAAIVLQHRAEVKWWLEHGLMQQAEADAFEEDARRAFAVGVQRGLEGPLPSLLSNFEATQSYRGDFSAFPAEEVSSGKTIVFVSRDYPPNHSGGIATFTKDLAESLADAGNLVFVVTESDDINRVDFENKVWIHRVRVEEQPRTPLANELHIPSHIWNWSAIALRGVGRISEHRVIDVIEAPIWDCEGVAFIGGEWPLVTSLQTTMHFWLDTHPENRNDKDWMKAIGSPILETEKYVLEMSNGVRAISRAIAHEIEENYGVQLGDDKTHVIPLGLSSSRDNGVVQPTWPVGVLFVGRLELRKGIDTLLEVIPTLANEFPEQHFTIVGDYSLAGPSGKTFVLEFQEQFGHAMWMNRVHFTGKVSQEQLIGFYQACDFLVAPSRFESFGLVYLEAMREGKAVIGCEVGGIPEVVSAGENGLLIPPGSSVELERAVRALLSDGTCRRGFGEAGKRLFESRFEANRMVEPSNELFEAAILVRADSVIDAADSTDMELLR